MRDLQVSKPRANVVKKPQRYINRPIASAMTLSWHLYYKLIKSNHLQILSPRRRWIACTSTYASCSTLSFCVLLLTQPLPPVLRRKPQLALPQVRLLFGLPVLIVTEKLSLLSLHFINCLCLPIPQLPEPCRPGLLELLVMICWWARSENIALLLLVVVARPSASSWL